MLDINKIFLGNAMGSGSRAPVLGLRAGVVAAAPAPEPKADLSKMTAACINPQPLFTQSSDLIPGITGRWEKSGKLPGNLRQQFNFIN
jgi:hypothetical protein